MDVRRRAPLLVWLVTAACTTTSPLSLPEPPEVEASPPAPVAARSGTLRRVPYPGLEVSYVIGLGRECYVVRDVYYTFAGGHWFYARAAGDAWSYVEMKYVPPDLFRVLGNRPPEMDGRAPPSPPPPTGVEDY